MYCTSAREVLTLCSGRVARLNSSGPEFESWGNPVILPDLWVPSAELAPTSRGRNFIPYRHPPISAVRRRRGRPRSAAAFGLGASGPGAPPSGPGQ